MPDDRGQYIGLRRGAAVTQFIPKERAGDPDFPGIPELVPFRGAPPLTEGYIVKGGVNSFPSQVKERPPAPGAINPRKPD